MEIEHIAIWTHRLELMKEYYIKYFQGLANEKYVNTSKNFESYFISFETGARLEIMQMDQIPENSNDTISSQHTGIIHIAFGVSDMNEVDAKAKELAENGFKILSGPRKTGDGYYEFETLDPDNNRLEVTARFSE